MKVIIFDTVYNEKRVLKKKQKNYIPRIGEYVIAFPYEYKARVTNVIYEFDKNRIIIEINGNDMILNNTDS